MTSVRKKKYLVSIVSLFAMTYMLISGFQLSTKSSSSLTSNINDKFHEQRQFAAIVKHNNEMNQNPDIPLPAPEVPAPVKSQVTKSTELLTVAVAKKTEKTPLPVDSKSDSADTTKNVGKKRYYVINGNNVGSNQKVETCRDGTEVQIVSDLGRADFSYFLNSIPMSSRKNRVFAKKNEQNTTGVEKISLLKSKKNHYSMVWGMESEPHSNGGETWEAADFRMWYDLDKSFPEPATYFDIMTFLPYVLAPPRVQFHDKEHSANIVWILSNCNAYNGRQKLVRKLMEHMHVDSYGACLRNKNTHTSVRMSGNVEMYAKYKFVLAIENSNCADYVTEKLVHAVNSGSIPIVAGKNNKPDYAKFMPHGSYINVYDFKTVKDLADHLEKVATNQTLYESYIRHKFAHTMTREDLIAVKPLDKLIDVAKKVIGDVDGKNEPFFKGIIGSEKSENKLCKVARYLRNTPEDIVHKSIEEKRLKRPSTSEACLPRDNLGTDLN